MVIISCTSNCRSLEDVGLITFVVEDTFLHFSDHLYMKLSTVVPRIVKLVHLLASSLNQNIRKQKQILPLKLMQRQLICLFMLDISLSDLFMNLGEAKICIYNIKYAM